MKAIIKPVRSLIAILLFSVALIAADAAELAGLKLGETAPSFALKNQDGQLVQSAELLKNGPLALVFFRSADW